MSSLGKLVVRQGQPGHGWARWQWWATSASSKCRNMLIAKQQHDRPACILRTALVPQIQKHTGGGTSWPSAVMPPPLPQPNPGLASHSPDLVPRIDRQLLATHRTRTLSWRSWGLPTFNAVHLKFACGSHRIVLEAIEATLACRVGPQVPQKCPGSVTSPPVG